ncbi:hypothetical protein [Halorarum salinum]|uniref:Uncharacterized protein n=1 Tax=Halorarum salinum TaxID=2743089 RepID=A0A7D5LD82_9EURY|nr:hypothetical protein [Halobaculum salinum]QLG63627.1 hypothetical protein HUG12_18590 [Halobaculum salinum]
MTRPAPTDRQAARTDEEGAPLVPDLGGRDRSGERGPRPGRPRRPDPFELDLMEDAE